eukprot:6174668-Pyramimonas_sp.AAC.1
MWGAGFCSEKWRPTGLDGPGCRCCDQAKQEGPSVVTQLAIDPSQASCGVHGGRRDHVAVSGSGRGSAVIDNVEGLFD